MDQPRRLFNFVKAVSTSCAPMGTSIAEYDAYTGDTQTTTGKGVRRPSEGTLPFPKLEKLLRHIRDWSSTSRTSGIPQTVLHAALKLRRAEDVRAAFGATSNTNTTYNDNDRPPSLEPNDEDRATPPPTQGALR